LLHHPGVFGFPRARLDVARLSMHIFGLIFLVALATALALTPLARWLALRLGAVDRPDGKRKLQKQPVPRWGGAAVYLALLSSLVGVHWAGADEPFGGLAWAIAISAGFVCLLGCVDDRWELSSRRKLALQIVSVLPVALAPWWLEGMRAVDSIVLFGRAIELGWLGVPLAVLWLVGCINALNLLDGMDGLASVVGFSTAAILAIIASSMNNDHVALAAVGLAGALAGFLVYNLPPARIYLGDSGSMVIGLVLGILGIQGSLKTAATLSITAPAVVMTIPLVDTALAILRRKLTGQPFDMPDRGHIHHRLLDRGLSTWQALCIIGSLCLATGASAAAATIFRSDTLAWVMTLGLVALMIRLRTFGHHEVSLVKTQTASLLSRCAMGLLLSIDPRGRGRGRVESLSFEQGWSAITAEAARCQASRLTMTLSLGGQRRAQHDWRATPTLALAGGAWSLELAFGDENGVCCRMDVAGQHAAGPAWQMWQLTELLRAFGAHWQTHPLEVPLVIPLERPELPAAQTASRTAA
jgi:UDP-GlcNAc:undecaprenyl-phosphate GlcNAc-1-phosphate transferase